MIRMINHHNINLGILDFFDCILKNDEQMEFVVSEK